MGRFQIPQPMNIQVGQVGPALKITEKTNMASTGKITQTAQWTHRSFKWMQIPSLAIQNDGFSKAMLVSWRVTPPVTWESPG